MKSVRIIQMMLPKGYKVEHLGKSKHLFLIDPNGDIVRDNNTNMPITFSNSPSGRSWESKVKRDIQKYTKGI